jgi:pimeloyl-ACP methyl ester carboxylesterase
MLVGHLYPSYSTSIIIMAHGFTLDKSARGRADILADAFTRSGFHVLTFDFSGCGESDDDSLTVAKEVDDLQSAIQFVKARGFKKITLYGHSLGSLICLKCAGPEIETMVLSGALTDAMNYDWDEYFSREQMMELEEKGYLTLLREGEIRKTVIVDKQMLMDFAEINQSELLTHVSCPVLLIHGNHDEEERLLLERSKRALQYLSNDSELKIIDGATHGFMEHLNALTEMANRWYLKHLWGK